MMAYDDTGFIVDELARRFPELVHDLYPAALEHKGRVYPSAKSAKDLGSFEICLTGPKAGGWYRHSQGVGGGPLALVAYALTGQTVVTRETFDYARRFLGIDRREEDDEARRRREQAAAARRRAEDARREQQAAEDARDREARLETAHGVWEASRPIAGTAAELYLHNRGLHLTTYPDTLRFHPSLKHPDGIRSPALVCRVDDVAGALTGVWRIFISESGQKANVSNVKLGLGPVAGGAVRLAAPINGAIGIAEGVETALAVHVLTEGRVACWAGLSTSGMAGFECPFEVERITAYPDGDLMKFRDGKWMPAPGMAAAKRLKAKMDATGVHCTIQPPPTGGRDFLDMLRRRQGEE